MDNNITIDTFSSVVLKVGKIISVDTVEKSKKLLVLKIDIGDEVRTIVSGIRKNYSPEEIIGRKCIIVANLEPKMMAGIESNGMLVCSTYISDDGNEVVEIIEPPTETPLGTRLS